MTKEALLLKDLCARLPYDVKVKVCDSDLIHTVVGIDIEKGLLRVVSKNIYSHVLFEHCTPYLRSMLSMTEKEIEEYIKLQHKDCIGVEKPTHCCKNSITAVAVSLTSRDYLRYWYNDMVSTDTIDFLNACHLDWRGLIPMGLALEALEGMYD